MKGASKLLKPGSPWVSETTIARVKTLSAALGRPMPTLTSNKQGKTISRSMAGEVNHLFKIENRRRMVKGDKPISYQNFIIAEIKRRDGVNL